MIDRYERPQPVLVELDPLGDGFSADVARPVLCRPDGRIRSPILERRPVANAGPRDDPPDIVLPPLRSFLGPLVWVLIPSLPVLSRLDWQAAAVTGVVALIVREVHLRADRSTISFGEGFLGYRARDGWPHGVQEEDEVHWNWKPARSSQPGQGVRA